MRLVVDGYCDLNGTSTCIDSSTPYDGEYFPTAISLYRNHKENLYFLQLDNNFRWQFVDLGSRIDPLIDSNPTDHRDYPKSDRTWLMGNLVLFNVSIICEDTLQPSLAPISSPSLAPSIAPEPCAEFYLGNDGCENQACAYTPFDAVYFYDGIDENSRAIYLSTYFEARYIISCGYWAIYNRSNLADLMYQLDNTTLGYPPNDTSWTFGNETFTSVPVVCTRNISYFLMCFTFICILLQFHEQFIQSIFNLL